MMDPFGIGPGPTITLGLSGIGLVGLVYTLRSDVAGTTAKCKKLEERVEELDEKVEQRERELAAYKLHVESETVKKTDLSRVEDRLTKKLDTIEHSIRNAFMGIAGLTPGSRRPD